MSGMYYKALAQEQGKELINTLGHIEDESDAWTDAIMDATIRLNNLIAHFENEEKEWEKEND